MFDNINPQANNDLNNRQPNSAPTAGADTGRSGLASNPASGRIGEITDIFADTEKPAKPDVFKPKPGVQDMSGADIDSIPPELVADTSPGSKIITLVIVIAGLGLLGFGGYYGLEYYKENIASRPTSEAENSNVPPETTTGQAEQENQPNPASQDNSENSAAITTDNGQETTTAAETGATAETAPGTSTSTANLIDTDQDGLTDAEELSLGTSPTNVDSDNDGLSDREEAKVYKTDPLNPDTDGDSFKDGDEVKSGYNPNGPGKLYDINRQ